MHFDFSTAEEIDPGTFLLQDLDCGHWSLVAPLPSGNGILVIGHFEDADTARVAFMEMAETVTAHMQREEAVRQAFEEALAERFGIPNN